MFFCRDDLTISSLQPFHDFKEGFMARQIKGVEVARDLYTTLIYTSEKNYKWLIQSNQINKCPVTLQDVNIAQNFWGKDISALKGKTTRIKPNVVARYQVKIPVDLLKLHKEMFMTRVFFENNIPLFITLSWKICFTAINNFTNLTIPEIFMAFKEVYYYYPHFCFRIITVHADG